MATGPFIEFMTMVMDINVDTTITDEYVVWEGRRTAATAVPLMKLIPRRDGPQHE